jgi:hypothetical protein
MKKEATDVLKVEVVKVEKASPKNFRREITLEAKVTSVIRSNTKVVSGEQIRINSYQLVWPRRMEPGPKPPPRLEPGWKGTVYLKASDAVAEVKVFDLAVFGHSFVPAGEEAGAEEYEEVKRAVAGWLEGMEGNVYKATIRASDGKSPLPATRINNRLFAFREGKVYIGIGFSKAPRIDASLDELRATFAHVALDRVPVPGIEAVGWETRLQTPISSFKKGVTLEAWEGGVLRLRVQTEFFAAYGRRTDILVPADAGYPEGTYFQIRKPITADLVIEGRLFEDSVKP